MFYISDVNTDGAAGETAAGVPLYLERHRIRWKEREDDDNVEEVRILE